MPDLSRGCSAVCPELEGVERMQRVSFWKYEGLGNDFILLDARRPGQDIPSHLAIRLCDRRCGVGGDGVLILGAPESPDAHGNMRLINADGSEAEMCGNGIRCVAKHIGDEDPGLQRAVISTPAGVKMCELERGPDGKVERVAVDMGPADFERFSVGMPGRGPFLDEPLEGVDPALTFSVVSMGNPHLVTFNPVPEDSRLSLGTRLQTHSSFPNRINVGFATILDDGHMRLQVFERGCGFTLACGTGAAAAAAVACRTGRMPLDRPLSVELPGGVLVITVLSDRSGILMEGPARLVFRGDFEWR